VLLSFFLLFLGLILIVGSAYVFYNWGLKYIVLFSPIVILLVYDFKFFNDLSGLIIPIIIGSLGGITYRYKKKLIFFLLTSSLIIGSLITADFYHKEYVLKQNLFAQSKQDVFKIFNVLKIIDLDKISAEKKKEIEKNYDEWLKIVKYIVPFTSFLYSLFIFVIGFFIVKEFLSKLKNFNPIDGLELFRLSEYLIFAVIIGWAIVIFLDKGEYGLIYTIGLNVALISSLLYFIQAIGVLKFVTLKKGIPKYVLPFFFLFTILMGPELFTFIIILLTGFGTLDLWADFRKLDHVESEE
jgi:predicted membrane protein DUF2232